VIPGRAVVYATPDGEVVAVLNRPPRRDDHGAYSINPYATFYVQPKDVPTLLEHLRTEGATPRPPLQPRTFTTDLPPANIPEGAIYQYAIPENSVVNVNPLAHAINAKPYDPGKRKAANAEYRAWAERHSSRPGA
jgi:hypothetical protein